MMDTAFLIFWAGAFLGIIAFSHLIISWVKLKQKYESSEPKE
jgi:hypothetical protein